MDKEKGIEGRDMEVSNGILIFFFLKERPDKDVPAGPVGSKCGKRAAP